MKGTTIACTKAYNLIEPHHTYSQLLLWERRGCKGLSPPQISLSPVEFVIASAHAKVTLTRVHRFVKGNNNPRTPSSFAKES